MLVIGSNDFNYIAAMQTRLYRGELIVDPGAFGMIAQRVADIIGKVKHR